MNHREPSPTRRSVVRAGHCLALVLLAELNARAAHAGTRLRVVAPTVLGYTWVDSLPYTMAGGSPPMRFAPEPPSPEISAVAALLPATADSTPDPAAKSQPDEPKADVPDVELAVTPAASNSSMAAPVKTPSQPASLHTSELLPDEAHPQVRPEDFLPFFQVPGSTRQPGSVSLIVPLSPAPPAPPAQPPSSATYIQSPR